jgi:acetyltransferase-like isoleucine patch superfamily enzyme
MKAKVFLFNIICLSGPWRIRRLLYNKLFGFNISKTSYIGYSFINTKYLEIQEFGTIGNLNIIKGLDKVILKEYAKIGNLNYISAYPSNEKIFFKNISNRNPELVLGKHSHITSRHLIDCSDKIFIDDFTIIAGYRSQFLTHSIDFNNSVQTTLPINIGKYCFISTDCTILKGAALPDYSVLGAKSLLIDKYQTTNYLYGGNPAKPIKYLDINEIKYFQRIDGTVY